MNHLKYIRGINVRASSKSALPLHYGQHVDVHFENCRLKSDLLRSNPLSAAKKNGVGVRHSGQFRQDSLRLVSKESKTICKQRSKSKSSVTSLKKKSSMHKKLPMENAAKRVCHYSTYQNAKFSSNGINKQFTPESDAIINGARNINRHNRFIASIEKHPRSYAEMIADYSESLYKGTTALARNDRFNNAIRKSPFSTFSAPSSAKTIVNVAEFSEFSTERLKKDFSLPVKSFDLCTRYNDVNTERYAFKHHDTRNAEAMNKNTSQNCVTTNDLKSDDQSYAKLVADCSKSMHDISTTSILNDGLESKENVLARNTFESVTTPRKNSRDKQNKLREITPTDSTMPFEKNIERQVIDLKEDDWLKEMENVMSDLKSATERKVAKVVPEMKENDTLQPIDASDNLDRNHGFADKLVKSNKQKVKDTTVRKLSYLSTKIDRMETRKKDFELQKHNYSLSSDKTSNPPQSLGNAAESSAVRKSSTHVSTSGDTGRLKQPQVKLHMVPSEKESFVSINVDQASTGSDPLNFTSKQLSVVVQSDQKEDPQLPDNQRNHSTLRGTKSALQRNNFGPMRISISEDSAPVKQIEFSINGKPVSELKSITARTERLDVVSSADKIEIRIPFAKDDPNALDKARENDLSKGINSNVGQVLNVQISANFQDESTKGSSIVETPEKTMRSQYGNDTIPKSSPSIFKDSYLANNFGETREEIFNSNNMQHKFEFYKRMNVKFNDERNIKKHKISDKSEIQRKATKSVLTGKTKTDISSMKQVNNVEAGSLNMRKADTTEFSEANKYNKNDSSDNRIPSKIIPWWSSSDSFNKIKKKEDDNKLPPTNQSNYKINLNQNLITETLLSKSKETSNSKILTKKTQSINEASNSNNINLSNSNSTKPYEESKSTLNYAHSYRLKSNQENLGIAPEIRRNNLKVEHNQALITNEDINQTTGIKQTKSNTLFKSDTMNIKDKHDSVKENTPVLQRKMKGPNTAQNFSPKKNQEKENNYSLKQTRSIDDVSKNITSKIKDILDAIKPIERKEDNILTDYSLKRKMLSRKPTILSSGMKEVQNPSSIITTNDLISNSSTAEKMSKRVDKTMLTKQIESTEEKLKTKMDISLKENNLKTGTTINLKALNENNVKALNENNVKNMKEIYKNDLMNSSSSNFNNFSNLTQTFNKQEQLDDINDSQDKSKPNLKSLLKTDKNKSTRLLNTSISSGPVQRCEKKSEISGKIEESKQNRPKSLISIKNISESEKVKGLTSSANSFKEHPPDTIMINKSPSPTVKQIQSKSKNKNGNVNKLSSSQTISNSTSKIKDCAGSKNLIDKNINEISVPQSPQTKKTDKRDMIARIVTQNPKSNDSFAKNYEENFNKSGTSKENHFESSKKPNNFVGFKSVGSKTKSTVISNNNCTGDRKLFMESFYSNFNRKNNIMSNSQSVAFKAQQNLSDMLEHPVPTAIGWNVDRPEKNILYSAWLQRFANNIKNKGKLF